MKLSPAYLVASLLTLALTAESISARGADRPSRPVNDSRPMFQFNRATGPYRRPTNSPASSLFSRNAASASQPLPYAARQPGGGRITSNEFANAAKRLTSPTTGYQVRPDRQSAADMQKYLTAAGALSESKGESVKGKVRERARSGNRSSTSAAVKGTQLSPYVSRNSDKLKQAMQAGSVVPGTRADQKRSVSMFVPKGIKPDASLIKKLSKNNLKTPSNDQANRRRPGGDAENIAGITTDENGVEHWESSWDEQLAIDNGGRYEWTDEGGTKYTTEVTAEGTRRMVTLPNGGGVASDVFTPHERRDANSETGNSDVDTALGIVDRLLGMIPNGAGPSGGAGYIDPGYVVPENAVPVDPGYASAVTVGYASAATGSQSIPATAGATAEADQDVARFTRRSLFVANKTDEPVTLYVQFRSQNENRQWVWLPADPGTSQDALTFELATGQEGQLEHNGAPIVANRVRIWAKSATREWSEYRNQNLWLVSERDASGNRAYLAAEMETFRFTIE